MVLIQLLLPTTLPPPTDRGRVESALALTRQELIERFDGLTAYVRAPAKGVWTAPDGRVELDDVVMVEIVADTFDRHWWETYVARLADRFNQHTIHVRALHIETLNNLSR